MDSTKRKKFAMHISGRRTSSREGKLIEKKIEHIGISS